MNLVVKVARLNSERQDLRRHSENRREAQEDLLDLIPEVLVLIQDYRTTLYNIQKVQPSVLAMIEANGFIFKNLGKEPGNWEHLAFTLYSEICEIESIARQALNILIEEEA